MAPDHLVGHSPIVVARIVGQEVPCLIDTGSQVSLLKESRFKQLFGAKGTQLQDPSAWLALTAANGKSIPYVGCLEASINIGGLTVPDCGIIVVRDHCLTRSPCLLGMNVLRHCWSVLFKDGLRSREPVNPDVGLEATPSGRQAWKAAMRLCNEEARFQDLHGEVSYVRVLANTKVPPGAEMVLSGRVRGGPGGRPYLGLVEGTPETESFLVARAVVSAKDHIVPVRVKNVCNRPLFLKKYQKLAQLSLIKPTDVLSGAVTLLMEEAGVMEVHLQPETSSTSPGSEDVPVDLEGSSLSPEECQLVRNFLSQHQHVFALTDKDYGGTHSIFHEIPTGDAAPIRQRYRQIAPSLYQEVRVMLQDLLEAGIIHKSTSPWASPIVLVKKKDGSTRFCVDYRKLNSVTRKDAFPLPRVEESLTMLSQAKFFSTLDLASGYWQVPVQPEDRQKTAFTTPMGLYEWDRMPFGLCNGPATFQRLMEACLGDLNYESLLIYLDDIIVFSSDFSTHLQRLELVFERLVQHGLKLKPSKCHLFRSEVKYLGHVVTEQGIAPLPERVEAIQSWPRPTTIRELRAFLGLTGYYRRFIKDFAKITMPLNKHLCGQSTTRKHQSRQTLKEWGHDSENAFQQLKQMLLQAPVLAYADFTLPFVLYTDASNRGLGAVLAQVQQGKERVIAYASRSLHPSEKNDSNYSSFKLEFLALKWAVTQKFHEYLLGAKFVVFTDNNPLAHLQTANLGSLEQRWAAQLANYNFDIKFRAGKANANADALSRVPLQAKTPEDDADLLETVCGEVVQVCCKAVGLDLPFAGMQDSSIQCLELTSVDNKEAQQEDPVIRAVMEALAKWPLSPAERAALPLEANGF